ncbi:hypothetical protein [Flavobacterium gawalongense]|uniref:Uncharacterized protein n=1 Tax=Flavobacterium gawalongense TaxID=2594432 RepID=A0A553BL55_9FLAO|nr:hypothetical protein [Flavobacterium gawalongense]TRX00393.1 hypothetical protein FNW33_11825 [Flavobacterium gawalongense]TRX05060.1 hypothetical protein FNW12_12165 [Flavobacterium gawalongense]TRX08979.1 hypothetical protein FNW11_10590 [Flavobacterium gawalongense]TRX10034.1 hypothetical protein FNW10_10210 [Flavobacterium gawalongense]TRX26933.1 hypothetical protein FNW38_10100 [Flavobacterium gawalongense]
MKKTITFLMLLLFTTNAFSQEFSKEYYLQKSKSQKSTGWILFTGGTIMTVVGAFSFNNSWDDSSNSGTDAYGFVMLGGVASVLGSIPFFIGSGKNARKAATISFINQPILIPKQGSLVQNSQPALSLKITF